MIFPFFLFHLLHRSNFSGGIATFRRSSSSESFLRLSLQYIIIKDIKERKLRNEVLYSKQLQHWRQISMFKKLMATCRFTFIKMVRPRQSRPAILIDALHIVCESDKTGALLGEVLKKKLQGHRYTSLNIIRRNFHLIVLKVWAHMLTNSKCQKAWCIWDTK
ncbi:uncharacterized protein LOC132616977 isoform X3 [Lycium barbarum]|uniref:uncharacterized protein LOC132616977 isoform X3 n=1 Tax=Lycium barbarum TaxID=112863 RepID=UPI00293E78D4|nr:uncharacterized protein LOC132616977 isoform X3 [Lycium barbarum]